MKVKEHIKLFEEDSREHGEATAAGMLMDRFLEELYLLISKRQITTRKGIEGAVKQVNDQWQALCRRDERFKPEGFIVYLKYASPELAAALEMIGY